MYLHGSWSCVCGLELSYLMQCNASNKTARKYTEGRRLQLVHKGITRYMHKLETLGPVLTMFRKSKSEKIKIKIGL